MDTGATAEAKRWLDIAERLLEVRDLSASKRFAERAMEADPLLDGVDQILAVADVLLASQRRVNNHVDWYAVLQLQPPSSSSPSPNADTTAVKRQFRRLALLLHPGRNSAHGADTAFRLVSDAFAVLSDPSKKALFDAELHIANSAAEVSASPKPNFYFTSTPASKDPFWTACPSCCYVHQYSREYLNQTLRCPNCSRAFEAIKLSAAPPVVPGTDMYYCSWGFFPLGFPGAPNIFAKEDLNADWNPFQPLHPSNHQQQGVARSSDRHVKPQNNGGNENLMEPKWSGSSTRTKKMAVKKVGRPSKKHPFARESKGASNVTVDLPKDPVPWPVSQAMPTNIGGVQGRDININQEVKIGSVDGVPAVDDYTINFHIDVNATDEILDNLQNLPFLRDDELHLRMP
ncbi:uncharacterized protein LOC121993000 [Zingiber officinale]|uniref:J domain-containing protein n=1 Tax=Zingiber officinale TaxID=94328 RepID=A0A8J5G632_ZINOF|nr:uncharacterized protein LOC121993000 [Zingiber officinale]KAG6496474.1 hypothetical protein ZIOFF_044341 [Zingiber officinale]